MYVNVHVRLVTNHIDDDILLGSRESGILVPLWLQSLLLHLGAELHLRAILHQHVRIAQA